VGEQAATKNAPTIVSKNNRYFIFISIFNK